MRQADTVQNRYHTYFFFLGNNVDAICRRELFKLDCIDMILYDLYGIKFQIMNVDFRMAYYVICRLNDGICMHKSSPYN